MKKLLVQALILFGLLTAGTGLIYPLLITGLAQIFFPSQANGSLITANGQTVGAELIAQNFTDPRYFWGRPSAVNYNAAASGASNLAPSNPALQKQAQERLEILRQADPNNPLPVPAELLAASGSGLDPDISPAAALYQVGRVARTRGLSEESLRALIEKNTQPRFFIIFGEERVNVLELNLALDKLK
jgi:K+-transporting ATPase ATPase C chain